MLRSYYQWQILYRCTAVKVTTSTGNSIPGTTVFCSFYQLQTLYYYIVLLLPIADLVPYALLLLQTMTMSIRPPCSSSRWPIWRLSPVTSQMRALRSLNVCITPPCRFTSSCCCYSAWHACCHLATRSSDVSSPTTSRGLSRS